MSSQEALSKKTLRLVQSTIDDSKGQDPVVIDLKGKTTIADYMVVVTGTSQRHLNAMADHLEQALKKHQDFSPKVEGKGLGEQGSCDWVLIDAGGVIVHLFRQEVRDFYALEKMWGLNIEAPAPSKADASLVKPEPAHV